MELLQKELNKEAKNLINQLAIVLRSAHFHSPDNVAVLSAIDKFVTMINPFIASEGLVTIELAGEYFHANDTRVRYSVEYLLNFDFLVRQFRDHELGAIEFRNVISPVDMQKLIRAFIVGGNADDKFGAMTEILAGTDNISISRLRKVSEQEGVGDIRKVVKKTYFNAVSYSKGIINKLKSGEKISLKKAKRVVESMVDLLLEEESLLLGMTAIKDYDEYTYHHSVNVSVLSVALGQKLGLSRKALTELGLVALFHDLGKMEIPAEILNKPSSFTDEEWTIVRKHPYWGAKASLKLKGFDLTSIKSAIVAFEHHLNYDLSGYPTVRNKTDLDFFSRIVTIADQYDAMTSSRVYSRTPLKPDKALSVMVDRAGKMIDPVLLKVFVNMVGVYPIGTLVFLDTREMGLVYESNPLYHDRPRVLVIVDGKGNKVEGYVVDLSEKDQQGKFNRKIFKTLDPNKYKINLSEYLL
jgi:HD-GYP domain-containing protein (c-di-GMP phosphodiesterase class II)